MRAHLSSICPCLKCFQSGWVRQCISNAKIKMCIMNIISRDRGEYLGGRVEWLKEVVQRWRRLN